jgi:hypothetical protein
MTSMKKSRSRGNKLKRPVKSEALIIMVVDSTSRSLR